MQNINIFLKFQPVPFEGGIPGGINPGRKVLLYGVVEKKASRFEVNLVKGNGDVALHFNPRFSEKVFFSFNFYVENK